MNFCKHCGARLTPGADHCPVCGAAWGPSANGGPEAFPAARPEPPRPAPSCPGGQEPSAPVPRYCGEKDGAEEAPSVWWYFGMLLLFAVPVAGLVAMICFSFLPGCSPRQRNLARACLLLALVLAAVLAIGLLIFTLLLGSWQRTMLYSYYFSY